MAASSIPLRQQLKIKSVKGTFWASVRNWGNEAISFLVFLVLARLLSPGHFGQVALAGIYINAVQILIGQGYGAALVRIPNLKEIHLNTVFWINVAVGGTFLGLSLLFSPWIALLLGHESIAPIVAWLSFSFFLNSLCLVQQALCMRDMQFRVLAMRSLVSYTIGGIVGITMAGLGCGVWSLVGQQISNGIAGTLLLWRLSLWRPRWEFSVAACRELLGISSGIFGVSLVDFFSRQVDQYMIGRWFGTSALGYYAISRRMRDLGNRIVINNVTEVTHSLYSRLQSEPKDLLDAFYLNTRIISVLGVPAFALLIFGAPDIITVLVGSSWLPAAPYARILGLAGLYDSISCGFGNVTRASGSPALLLLLRFAAGATNVLLFLIMIHIGLLPALLTMALRSYVFMPLEMALVRKTVPVTWTGYFRSLSPCLAGAGAMALLWQLSDRLLRPTLPSWLFLLATVGAGGFLYLAVIHRFAPQLLVRIRHYVELIFSRAKSYEPV